MKNLTTIAISLDTKKRLSCFGEFGQTYDDIIQKLIKKQVENFKILEN